jgi:hypothetical protein
MNINFNSLSNFTISFCQEKILLTDQRKKILIVVSIAFGFLTACYLITRHYWFRAKKESEIMEDDKEEIINHQGDISPKQLEIEASLNLLSQIPKMKGPKEILGNPPIYEEGLKVRTFCLELLSNMEECTHIYAFKNAVRYFLEHGALQKQAGFADYLKLIEILEEGAKQINPLFENSKLFCILKKHSKIIHLQKNFPQKEKISKKACQWDKIRTMVRAGLLTRDILKTADQAKRLGLRPVPLLPETPQLFNLYPIVDAINLLASDHREAGRWLMHHVKILTFRQLCESIQQSCHKLRQDILNFEDYYLLTIQGKSQEWMASIAYRYLPQEKLPVGNLTIGKSGDVYDQVQKIGEIIIRTNSDNFLMFDDVTYSGTQLKEYLARLERQLSIYFSSKKNQSKFLKTKNIYFVYGASPKDQDWNSILKAFDLERFNVKVHFICSHLFEKVDHLMDEENLTKSMRNKIHKHTSGNKTLVVTEWKTPDHVSVPCFVTNGFISSECSRINVGELNFIDFQEAHNVTRFDGVPPITDVLPPYKIKSQYFPEEG